MTELELAEGRALGAILREVRLAWEAGEALTIVQAAELRERWLAQLGTLDERLGAEEALQGGVGRVIIADGRVAQPISAALAGSGTMIQ